MKLKLTRGAALLATLLLALNSPTVRADPGPSALRQTNVELIGQVGGPIRTLAVQGPHAYVGIGPRLVVLDVSEPAAPRVQFQGPVLPGNISRLVVSDGYAYVLHEPGLPDQPFTLRIYQLADPVRPVQVGRFHPLGAAKTLAVDGARVYLGLWGGARHQSGVLLLDVSDRARPTQIGLFALSADTTGLFPRGNELYVTALDGLHVADVSDPRRPVEIGSYRGPGSPLEVVVSGDYAYLPMTQEYGGSLRIVDVRDPTRPVEVGAADAPQSSAIVLAGRHAYVPGGSGRWRPSGVRVFDVGDPTSPRELAFFETSLRGGLALVGSTLYTTTERGLEALDVSDPAGPRTLGAYHVPLHPRAVASNGPYTYVGDGAAFRVLDLTNPQAPVTVGLLEKPPVTDGELPLGVSQLPGLMPTAIAAAGRYAYLLSRDSFLVVDVSEPTRPTEVGSVALPEGAGSGRIALAGTIAYVALGQSGVAVVDVSEPASPAVIATYDLPDTATDVAVAGHHVYVATHGAGLRIIDVSLPRQPTEVAALEVPAPVLAVAASGNRAFIGAGGTVRMVDVAEPSQPVEVGRFDTGGVHVRDLAAVGDLLYVAAAHLLVVDVGDPGRPVEVGFFAFQHQPYETVVADDELVFLANANGLWIASFTGAPPRATVPAERCFAATGFCVEDEAFWNYFSHRGGVAVMGYPISRTFPFLGQPTQFFQRLVLQRTPDGDVRPLNLLDPDVFPFTQVNFSTFPPPNEALKAATPKVGEADYAPRILDFVRQHAPDQLNGEPVRFGETFFGTIPPETAGTDDQAVVGLLALEVWGAPISHPTRDPNNPNFVYQRFQRGIMHYDATSGSTRGMLLADYFKQLIRDGNELPLDLWQQAEADLAAGKPNARYFAQYCRGAERWLCRPHELPGTDLTFAFEQG